MIRFLCLTYVIGLPIATVLWLLWNFPWLCLAVALWFLCLLSLVF